MSDIDKVIEFAKGEVGYLEKASNSSLYDKTGNAGFNNYTKYWADLCPTLQGQPWCLCFCCYVFKQIMGESQAKKSLYMPSWTFYTPTAANYFKQNNAWSLNPSVGSLVFFKNDTRIHHVGIVYDYDMQYVYTIEGNTTNSSAVVANGGGVFMKKYARSNKAIAGYGVPKYSSTVPEKANYTVGIDVSKYQKTIDWNKVKATGVQFAILKAMTKDGIVEESFERNYKGALDAGIKIAGVYNYSYATTTDEAVRDANEMIRILGERAPMIWLDVEDKCQQELGKTLIDIINTYKMVVNAAKCDFGLYTGLSFYETYIKPYLGDLSPSPLWIARYPSPNDGTYKPNYKPNVPNLKIWQYSSAGVIDGINANVDMNVMFDSFKLEDTMKTNTSVVTETPVMIMGKVTASTLNVRKEANTSSNILLTLKSGDYVQMVGDLSSGWYRLSTGGYVSKKYISIVHGRVLAKSLHMRSTPDKTREDNKMCILSIGTIVTILSAAGEWYYVLTNNNKTGYVSGKYIELI